MGFRSKFRIFIFSNFAQNLEIYAIECGPKSDYGATNFYYVT